MAELLRKLFGVHSPSKLLHEQTVKALAEADKEVEEWRKNNSEKIKEFQRNLFS